ncbi:helix-turn-helix domain-containing protein [Nitrospinota bacterium]
MSGSRPKRSERAFRPALRIAQGEPPEKRLLDAREAAAYLGLSEHTIRQWASMRKIPTVKLGRALRFDRMELDECINSHRIPPLPSDTS